MTDPRKLAEDAIRRNTYPNGSVNEKETKVILARAYLETLAEHNRLRAVAEAAERLNSLHRDCLGVPVLAQDDLDAAVEAWADLRAALAIAIDAHGGSQ
jgi:hypothetical protein